jgi:hypothetical protein
MEILRTMNFVPLLPCPRTSVFRGIIFNRFLSSLFSFAIKGATLKNSKYK